MLTLAILNHLIQQNVEIQAQWQQHQDRVIRWVLPMTALHGRIDAQGFWQPDTANADVTITLPAATLTKMLSAKQLGVGDINIQGDQTLGLAILPLLQQLHYDWRDDLVRLLGDMAGSAVVGVLDHCIASVHSSNAHIMHQISDYASEHDAEVLGRKPFKQFSQQVAQLRDDEARLQQRLQRLQQQHKAL